MKRIFETMCKITAPVDIGQYNLQPGDCVLWYFSVEGFHYEQEYEQMPNKGKIIKLNWDDNATKEKQDWQHKAVSWREIYTRERKRKMNRLNLFICYRLNNPGKPLD